MGDFSIPGIQLHKVIQGAVNRTRHYQDQEWEEERARRDSYTRQLTALIPTAGTGADIEAINAEIARVQAEPREKKFSAKLIKTPSATGPKQPTGQQGGAGAMPDFGHVLSVLTGQPPPQQQQGSGQGAQAQGAQSASPSAPSMPAPAPDGRPIVPPVGAGSLMMGGGMGMGSGMATPPITPPTPMPTQVMTPPGRNVPEPSPLVGTLPGTPSPMGAGAGAGMGMGMGAAPPSIAPAAPSTPTPMGTPLAPVTPSPFMGNRERAELPYQLNELYGMNKSGKLIGAAALSAPKPLLTVKDLISARDKGLDIIPDPNSPTGFSVQPVDTADLSAEKRARVGLIDAQTELTGTRAADIGTDNVRADELLNLKERLGTLDAARKEAKTAREIANIDFKRTMTISRSYETAIKWYNQRNIALDQATAQLDLATGVSDYIAILSTVHAIDNTAAREGEVATVRGAAPFVTRIEQAIERFKTGELLAPEMRAEFKSALAAMKESHKAAQADVDQKYAYQTYKYMLDPKATGVGEGMLPSIIPRDEGGVGAAGAAVTPPTLGATPAPTTTTSAAAPAAEPLTNTMVNPATGQRIGWSASKRAWVDAATGKPINAAAPSAATSPSPSASPPPKAPRP